MTLKEKFENVLHNWIDKDYNRQHVANECEKVAEDFAIGFAEWAIAKNMGVNKFTLYEGELEMYKKEKGL